MAANLVGLIYIASAQDRVGDARTLADEAATLAESSGALRDPEALGKLFEPEAVLHPAGWRGQAHGREQVERLVLEMWAHQRTYVADPRTVLQLQGTALIISESAVNVVRRAPDGSWRYAIVHLSR